jgi:hypothetical protein
MSRWVSLQRGMEGPLSWPRLLGKHVHGDVLISDSGGEESRGRDQELVDKVPHELGACLAESTGIFQHFSGAQ